MVSTSIKVAGAGWQSCGTGGKTGENKHLWSCRGDRAAPGTDSGAPRPAAPAGPAATLGESYIHDKSVHYGLGIAHYASFPGRGRRCGCVGHACVLLSLYR